jgi:hypothetical protein
MWNDPCRPSMYFQTVHFYESIIIFPLQLNHSTNPNCIRVFECRTPFHLFANCQYTLPFRRKSRFPSRSAPPQPHNMLTESSISVSSEKHENLVKSWRQKSSECQQQEEQVRTLNAQLSITGGQFEESGRTSLRHTIRCWSWLNIGSSGSHKRPPCCA